ncbi:hypothetical protein ASPZODRAFT_154480 [Penicilliopsis zonata CBS 506.65]|uniref:Zn(2)-C6 fungal-type domain-containing protein n=1 Tax=Penicilliopsis zonata CBS 506.65 TaxID=1073090 RepID=A0A1L9S916_9EURO|nr:hypothetical protein ASPZODRAFT_154480 [Penicilliopsis zonata CBS 506.65]OJJ43645.1 hypothetical protein ASPZODRAFT_154480 [Penicilliopsis zonata CBS 506.65]
MPTRSSTRPSVDRQQIDRVLKLRRQQREARACYPCRQRKVKCDNAQPCRTCRKRGHPDICVYDVDQSNESERRPLEGSRLLSPARDQAQRSPPQAGVQGVQDQDWDAVTPRSNPERDVNYSGDNSLVSILRFRAQGCDGTMAQELAPVLGLQNTYNIYPFMEAKLPQDRWSELVKVAPQRDEVLKYFHFHRTLAHPFNPILVDIDRFEADMCAYLNAYAAGEIQDPQVISERWANEKSIGLISLLLATLASGAHFSDLENPRRSEVCRELARRAFQALRLANFLFRPSLDIVQTLLILGNTLQNNGQSDAAWALLGTTVRLAQALGLHREKSFSSFPESVKSKAISLWNTIIWQDSLLSLCYDRPPIASAKGWNLDQTFATCSDLSYVEIMRYNCFLGIEITSGEQQFQDASRALDALSKLDEVYSRAQAHLQDRGSCTTLHQNLEHLALKMHISSMISILCRPAIKSTAGAAADPEASLRTRAKQSLLDATKAFLDFQALSTVPLRTWSMVHTVLSSTLLLCIWDETRNEPLCLDTQQKVIEVFSGAESATNDDGRPLQENSQWLSERHIKTLVTLRNAVQSSTSHHLPSRPTTTAVQTQRLVSDDLNATSPLQQCENVPPNFGHSHISPVTYLDSIMNVPLFDFSLEDGLLEKPLWT